MNLSNIVKIDGKCGAYRLLYSHDDGYTRYVVQIEPGNKYSCLINEGYCFRRGTHDKMARLYDLELSDMECMSFYYHKHFM